MIFGCLALCLLLGCGQTTPSGGACSAGSFDRSCRLDSDCAALNHQTDCCGSQTVLGVSRAALQASQQREDSCAAAFPLCQCATRGPVAEDGNEVLDGASLKVRCAANRCGSFVQR